ncbi:hypothetical protein GOC83_09905 [Haloarcula rubripromontorii]|uniref:Replication protein n=1 Tax=Haloarcula rubripromontorii TaxID=1705562 RepID=A0A847U6F6_9EURY|nr:hypothetical protein [Haloarcula rubripromontorii]NLV06441.1 hypothetical protein [Haloarcula rubripromontorii]
MSVTAKNGHGEPSLGPQTPIYSATDHKEARPLTARGEQLPAEYVDSSGYPRELGECIRYLASDVADEPTEMAFESGDGEIEICESHGRFTENYADERYASLMELDRGVMAEYSNPHTVMLSLTGTVRNEKGGWRCPVDHAVDLFESRAAVRQALRRALKDRRHETATVIGYHKNGYLHAHIGIWVEGSVSKADFRPAIDAHVRNSPIAKASHHSYEKAITVQSHPHSGRVEDYESGLGQYLGNDIIGIDGDVNELDDDAGLQAAVTVKAAGINMVSLPRGWRDRLGLENDADSDSEWSYIGVVDDDGNVVEADNDGDNGGADWVEPKELEDAVDPTSHLDEPPD